VKIALVTRRYPPLIGGAEKVLSYLAPALVAEGADVVVLTEEPREPPVIPQSSVRVVRLASARSRFVGTWLYMRRLARWFAENPVEVAYVSMLKHDAYVTIDAGREYGFPVVLRPEGAGVTGDLAWQSWGRFGQKIARRCRQADAVVAISPAIHAELIADGYDPGRIHDLPNGVPVPDESWGPRADWQSAPRAIFVGRLAPEKGVDLLIDAWWGVLAEHPRARLIVAGEGPERPALEAWIKQLKLSDAIELAGTISDVNPLLRSADLFVLPSREEGMSIALLEAMALAMPVAASNIAGNRALIDDHVHGVLFAANDRRSLERAILRQWSDLGTAAAMGKTARQRVVMQYSISSMARKHIDLFASLVRKRLKS
jgi:glycosyltransferase involved in cell wall biosynthesis